MPYSILCGSCDSLPSKSENRQSGHCVVCRRTRNERAFSCTYLLSCPRGKKIPVEIPFLTFMHTFIRSTCTAQLSLFFATNLAITRYCETQSNLLHSNARPLCTLPICQWSPLNSASRLLMWATVCLTVRAATRFEKAGSNHLRFNELTISLLIIQAWPS